MMLEIVNKDKKNSCRMMVVGVGGAGNNAINRMIDIGMDYVEFLAINTDMQDLLKCKATNTLQIGRNGLGAGAIPVKGQKAAEDAKEDIEAALSGVNMVFITAGMGGGTGTGAGPVVAKITKDMGILTAAVVTKPFRFEGKKRMDNALAGIEKLSESVDTLIVIPNEQIRKLPNNEDLTFKEGMMKADEVLQQSVQGITELIANVGSINLDFSDLQTAMKDKGIAHIGIGEATGEDRAKKAVKQAIESPLLETTIDGASDVIVNIRGNVTMRESEIIGDHLIDLAGYETNVLYGVLNEDTEGDIIRVTVIATGIKRTKDILKDGQLSIPETLDIDGLTKRKNTVVYRPVVKPAQPKSGIKRNALKRPDTEFEVPGFLKRMNDI